MMRGSITKLLFITVYLLGLAANVLASNIGNNPVEEIEYQTYHTKDYGIIGCDLESGKNVDVGPAFRKLLTDVIEKGEPAKILFEKKRYYFGPCLDHKEMVSIFHARNLIIDGGGASFVFHPKNGGFHIYRSDYLSLKNFKLWYEPALFTQGEITEVNVKKNYFKYKIQEGFEHPTDYDFVKENRLNIAAHYDTSIVFDPQSGRFLGGFTKPIKIVREPGNDPDEFTVYVEEYGHTQSALASYKPGHVAITKQFFVDYEKEFAAQYQPFPNGLKKHFDGGFHFSFVRNFTLENVVLMGMPGLGFKGRIDDSLFKNVTVRPFHERGQIISVTRGGFIIDQMFNSRVEDCHFEGTMDDLSALRHIPCYLTGIDQTKGKQRILLQPRTSPNRPFNFDVGDQIVTFDVNTATKSRPYRIMKVEIDKAASIKTSRDLISRPDIDYTSAWVTLDRPITEDLVVKTGDAKTYNRFYIKIDQPNVITNTVFSNCFRSGSLVSSGHIYSNCKFYHTAYGLHISDRDHGLEDFHVVDCLFYGQRLPSINIGKAPGANASRFKTNNVKILRNTFYVTKAKQSAMKISHVSDIEIRDNQIYINETELKKYLPGIIKSSGEVIFENNIVRKGPLAHADDFNASSLEQYQDWEQVADYFEISAR